MKIIVILLNHFYLIVCTGWSILNLEKTFNLTTEAKKPGKTLNFKQFLYVK